MYCNKQQNNNYQQPYKKIKYDDKNKLENEETKEENDEVKTNYKIINNLINNDVDVNEIKIIINKLINKILYSSLDVEPLSFNYKFEPIKIDNYKVFIDALTHKSFDDENNYEVLECIGDGYLKGIILTAIKEEFKNANEGYLTEVRFTLENTETFSKLLNSYFPELINLIRMKDIRKNDITHIYEDVFEAFFGALFDYAMSNNQTLINHLIIYYKNIFIKHIQFMKINNLKFETSYVKNLAIYCNKYKKDDPKYTVINKINTDDGIKIYVKLIVNDIEVVKFGSSVKDAEKNCAKTMLEILKNHKTKTFNINDICWFD